MWDGPRGGNESSIEIRVMRKDCGNLAIERLTSRPCFIYEAF